jgi:hypothetical protein
VVSFLSVGWVVMAMGAADFGSVEIVAGRRSSSLPTDGFMAGERVASFLSVGWLVMAMGAADFGSVEIEAGGGDLEVEGEEEEQPPVPQTPPTMAMTSSKEAIIPNKT